MNFYGGAGIRGISERISTGSLSISSKRCSDSGSDDGERSVVISCRVLGKEGEPGRHMRSSNSWCLVSGIVESKSYSSERLSDKPAIGVNVFTLPVQAITH